MKELSPFLMGAIDLAFSLEVSNCPTWRLFFSENTGEIPPLLTSLGTLRSGQNVPDFPIFVYRGNKPVNNLSRISGNVIQSIYDLPWEELIKLGLRFSLSVRCCPNESAPMSDQGGMVRIKISTDNEHVSSKIAQWLGGFRVKGKESKLYMLTKEFAFFFRPPISSGNFFPEGVLSTPVEFSNIAFSHPRLIMEHCLICGQPGSGKTNTVMQFLDQYISMESLRGFLLFDFKGEYNQWVQKNLNSVKYYAFGKTPRIINELKINPFIPPNDVTLDNHISNLAIIFTISSFGGATVILPGYMKFVIQEFFRYIWKLDHPQFSKLLYYSGKMLKNKRFPFFVNDPDDPDFSLLNMFCKFWEVHNTEILTGILGQSQGSLASDLVMTISARIRDLQNSLISLFSYTSDAESIDRLLSTKAVISLQGCSDNNIDFILSFLVLSFITVSNGSEESLDLKNLIVVEEAHRVLGKLVETTEVTTSKGMLTRKIQQALAEQRSKGVGIIIVDQSPQRLEDDVLSNTGTKIVHRLSSPKDQEIVNKAIMASDAIDFTSLDQGECVIKIQGSPIVRRSMPKWKNSNVL